MIVPLRRGSKPHAKAINLPPGTVYTLVRHDPGEEAQAVNAATAAAQSEYVLLSAKDAWWDKQAIEFLYNLASDSPLPADVAYGGGILYAGEKPQAHLQAPMFCPQRLYVENYLPSYALVRRSKFLEVGGLKSPTGKWDLWRRLYEAGASFKAVPEAYFGTAHVPLDDSPEPPEPKLHATWYHQATLGTTYWRCQLPARALPGQVVFNVPAMAEKEGSFDFPLHRGTAIFQFCGDAGHLLLTRRMRELGVRVLIEVDDDYANAQPNMERTGWKKKISETLEGGYSVELHRLNVAEVDGVTVTSEHLAKQYRKLNPNVYVCPNQLDPADYPPFAKPDDGILRIGWFGSASHQGDGKLLGQALEWAGRQRDVEITMIGVGQSPNGRAWWAAKKATTDKSRARFPFRHVSWSNDFGVYRKFLLDLDIGLAPVVQTPWAACRSDLKAIEYLAAGAYPVLSDTPPFSGWQDGERCLKAADEKGFLRALQHLVAHRNEVRGWALEGRDYVLNNRTIHANANDWRTACGL